jgi:hypothetical protein
MKFSLVAKTKTDTEIRKSLILKVEVVKVKYQFGEQLKEVVI